MSAPSKADTRTRFRSDFFNTLGYQHAWESGQSVSALPSSSDVNLLGDHEGIIDLDTEVSDGALHLCMAEEQLYRP